MKHDHPAQDMPKDNNERVNSQRKGQYDLDITGAPIRKYKMNEDDYPLKLRSNFAKKVNKHNDRQDVRWSAEVDLTNLIGGELAVHLSEIRAPLSLIYLPSWI